MDNNSQWPPKNPEPPKKKANPKKLGAKTVCVELTNGGICYVATKQGYLLKGYEMKQGFYDYHAGQKIQDDLMALAHQLGR